MTQDLVFSIVVPTYNRVPQLVACLRAIGEIAYPTDRFEVVVVNDGGKEPLEPVLHSMPERINRRLVEQTNAGPAAARNAGVRAACGRFIVFTDDDCQPSPDMLTALEATFARFPGAAIGGRTVNALPDNIYSEASQDMVEFLIRHHHAAESSSRFFTTSNLSLARAVFDRVGGFSASFPLAAAEDREFCERLVNRGVPLLYAPEVMVRHAHGLTLPTFWRQHFRYGRGRRELDRARTDRGTTPQFEKMKFYLDLVADPLRRHRNGRGVRLTLLNALSQAAYVSGYISERFARPRSAGRDY